MVPPVTLALTDNPAPNAEDPEGGGSSLLGSFVIAARRRGVHLSVAQLLRDHQLASADVTIAQLLRIAEKAGLRAQATRLRWSDLVKMGTALPAIVRLRNGSAMVLMRIHVERQGHAPVIVLQDPNAPQHAPLMLDEARFTAVWDGDIILVKRDYTLHDEDQPFGFRFILAQLLRDRRIVRDLGICAVILGIAAISPIVFWRVLIDRVMYYGSLNTFTVICIGFGVILLFDTAFGYLRRYLVVFLTTRADVKLWSFTFDKLLNLPIEYFERNPTGELVHKFHEMAKVRQFLVTQLFGTGLDAIVIVLFLPIMFFFSTIMTVCVLVLCALICGWLILMLPAIRRRVSAVIAAETRRGSFLIETIHGIRAVKSLALDPKQRHQWDVYTADVAEKRLAEGGITNWVQTVVHPLQVLMVNGVVAVAVYLALVNKDPMYIGAIIAFMMLTNRVVAPLIQASAAITQIDEARSAVRMVADMVNQPPEEGRSGRGIRTPLVGRIEFSEVTFRYEGSTTPALDKVSFSIPEGTVFGIIGRSGSGKTTVTRLLQLLHSNYQGLIKIDGNDLREIDVDHLRSSAGVVLQENFLFRGSIRDTIAASKPDASFEEVVQAARLAGAEEFIERLPRGYETWIQEGSTNLSGGQRQRLAIARALIGNPRILILDEATSALDADSEAIVNANLLRMAQGRTLIIISHRLSSLVNADSILVLERGRVYDIGTHEELLDRCDIYSGLWHQQHRHLITRPTTHEIIPFPSAAQ
ncbi:MAG: peptidase domain-containing ABC transporter [Alphaproteobacteria bacterium]|nr:peptidase domain-containing ABC transporter [Alphaproteobacteria bacterium]